MAFNLNNRLGFGNNNSNEQNQTIKPNFGARKIDDIKEEMNNLKYNHGLSKKEDGIVKKEPDMVNHQDRVNDMKQINGFNKRI